MSLFRTFPPLILAFFAVVLALVLCAAFAGPLAPHDIARVDLLNRFRPPALLGGCWRNPLGTDSLGRDIFSLVLRGIQVSMMIAAIGTVGGAIFGSALGFLAAWVGGWVDNLIGVLIDFPATIPNLILALALLAALPGASFALFIVIMIIYGWEQYARLACAIGLSAKSQPYVQAQQVPGAVGGVLCPARLGWLADRLAEAKAAGLKVIVLMHHNPATLQMPVDTYRLTQPEELLAVQKDSGAEIIQILAGHVHIATAGSWGGIPCATINGNQHRVELYLRGRTGQQACYSSPAHFAVLMSDGTDCAVHFHNYTDDSPEMDPAHFPYKMNQRFEEVG